jgi:hypothetical protein
MLVWRSSGSWNAASLNVNISAMDESFPPDISINALYDSAKNGEIDEVSGWRSMV